MLGFLYIGHLEQNNKQKNKAETMTEQGKKPPRNSGIKQLTSTCIYQPKIGNFTMDLKMRSWDGLSKLAVLMDKIPLQLLHFFFSQTKIFLSLLEDIPD